jgi:hypothetical protein
MRNYDVVFKTGEVEQRIIVEMPDCDDTHNQGLAEEDKDTVSFALQLSDPKPDGTKLSKRSTCFINIEPNDDGADLA